MSRGSRRLDTGVAVPRSGQGKPPGAPDRALKGHGPRDAALIAQLAGAQVRERDGIRAYLRKDGSPRALATLAELEQRWAADAQLDLSGFRDVAAQSGLPVPGGRWRVMVKDELLDGWTEWCRWTGRDFDVPATKQEARNRAAQFRETHPGWVTRVEKTTEPVPANFNETFEPLLKPGSGEDSES